MALILPRRKSGALDISELFSTDLYLGNSGSLQAITNGIDLAGEGGLVWIKNRDFSGNHVFQDTMRGTGSANQISSNLTDAASVKTTGSYVSSFNSDGFATIGGAGNNGDPISSFNKKHVSWTFRKSPSFFDVVTYTGDGTAGRTISHNLGVTPGMIVVKSTSTTIGWLVYHRSLGNTGGLRLDTTNANFGPVTWWDSTDPTSSEFYLGSGTGNNSGEDFVAYLFAHDTTDNGVIQCGSFTTDGSGNATETLPWDAQFVIIKSTATQSWFMFDSARGDDLWLSPNTSGAESDGGTSSFTFGSSQFSVTSLSASQSYIYVAIRKEGV